MRLPSSLRLVPASIPGLCLGALLALLALFLLPSTVLAQGGGQPSPGQVPTEIPGGQQGEAGENPTEEELAAGDGIGGYSTAPIHVQVLQDPIRIAPGETGTVLLNVSFGLGNDDASIARGGKAVFDTKQGELALGGASFDPPPGGADRYRKSLLVRIPVSVSSKAKHGKLSVAGRLELPARYVAGRPTTKTPIEKVSWGGTIVCGPPVPRPVVRKRTKRRGGNTSTTTGGGRGDKGAGDSGGDAKTNGGTGSSGSSPKPDSLTGSDGEERSDDLGDGFDDYSGAGDGGVPSWLFLAIGAVGVLMLLVSFFRKK